MTLTTINKAEALRYMGQPDGKMSPEMEKLLERCEKEILEQSEPKFTYRCFGLEKEEDGITLSGTSLKLIGNDIKNHLKDCTTAILMCATLGIGADRAIKKLSLTDIADGYAADALASAAVEQLCDRAEEEIKKRFPDRYFTWRFSPGYGDLPIDIQRRFLEVTDAGKRIGLRISDGGMLIPSKSVTAVVGITETEIKKDRLSCRSCKMYDRCSFRKDGRRCEI